MKYPLRLFPRKTFDIRWTDLLFALWASIVVSAPEKAYENIRLGWKSAKTMIIGFSVRTLFDAYLSVKRFPAGSEVVFIGMTIQDMPFIAQAHGLVPVPADIVPSTLEPDMASVSARVNEKTVLIVFAHLFGARVSIEPLLVFAHEKGIVVVEDCAQAFLGTGFSGHSDADITFFSFGSIKTSTSLGAGVGFVRNKQEAEEMERIVSAYPQEPSHLFRNKVLKYAVLKLLSNSLIYGFFVRCLSLVGIEYDRFVSEQVKGFPGNELLAKIKRQLSSGSVRLLARRIAASTRPDFLHERRELGRYMLTHLPTGVNIPGSQAVEHSFWIFPVSVDNPIEAVSILRTHGFDASLVSSSVKAVLPPVQALSLAAERTEQLGRSLIYIPFFPGMSHRLCDRLVSCMDDPSFRAAENPVPVVLADANRITHAQPIRIVRPVSSDDLKAIVSYAKAQKLHVTYFGTRHNQGGHAFADRTLAIDMTHMNRVITVDAEKRIITVEAGCVWEAAQDALHPYGLAVRTMQSSNKFTVGGALAANIHGRDVQASCIRNSIFGFRLMTAEGEIHHVTRQSNAELFHAVIGGYGLCGIVTEVDIAVVPNTNFRHSTLVVDFSQAIQEFLRRRNQNKSILMMARPSIAPRDFLQMTIVNIWEDEGGISQQPLLQEAHVFRDRLLFHWSRRSSLGKEVRTRLERWSAAHPGDLATVSRTNAMRPPVAPLKAFEYDMPEDGETIMEFFIPIGQIEQFFSAFKIICLEEHINLLGVTLRYIQQDREGLLSYAPDGDAFAVMCYVNHPFSAEGRSHMERVSHRLVEETLACNGKFYLSYHAPATLPQLMRAYPRLPLFLKQKLRYDPEERFTSTFYERVKGLEQHL